MPVKTVKLGPKFGVKDAMHPNGHRGTDFNGFAANEPLLAVADGMSVVMNKWSDALGNVLVLQVGNRFFGYCHMIHPSPLKIGDKVNSGAVVGHAGTTGSASTGVHLHLTLSDNVEGVFSGTVEDAYAFLVAKIAAEKK
jgi:murein DD-endopeptidase MepM/ murein hydrolase activator NlpD